MVNSLTSSLGATFGPIVLETLVKHYFERLRKEAPDGKNTTKLRQDELLYDQAFNLVKNFLAASSLHTVEECQSFSNTRTPSPPWVRVVRVLIPMSCCDDAAEYLIGVLGGEDMVKRTVGGTKWWQVRGLDGVDSQWIVAKKDWREAKKRSKKDTKIFVDQKGPEKSNSAQNDSGDTESGTYQQDMDEMRCILYSHGGGYYFGSVDQERYAIQRFARKMSGRVFAVNYRLAPQYPFPCAVQDMLAAYLFLIRPPPDALHRPVKPCHIIVAGDSAGGGIILALLQVLRDSELPLPAGATLISPWCDLSHSFPSIHTNTKTDVIPEYGLSLQKPSTLWPPPSDEMTRHVHASLRSRIRQMVHLNRGVKTVDPSATARTARRADSTITWATDREEGGPDGMPVDVGTTTAAPPLNAPENQTISLVTKAGETLAIDQQVHLYTQNSLIVHPLVSPVLSYLGGLPPLLVIAGDKEVLRDEIIYMAHKAASPSKYPIKDATRVMYPPLDGIEKRFGPTPVHLQVYDDAAHVLPVLFSFTTPAKFCFRAIATFCKQVTGVIAGPQFLTSPASPTSSTFRSHSPFTTSPQTSISNLNVHPKGTSVFRSRTKSDVGSRKDANASQSSLGFGSSRSPKYLKRRFSQVAMAIRGSGTCEEVPPVPKTPISNESEDVAGPRFHSPLPTAEGQREAGDPIVYSDTEEFPSWNKGMIRERVSIHGIIRFLEPENELDAFHVPQEFIGAFSELAVRRYLDAKAKFDKKFSGVQKVIDKRRRHNLDLAKKDISKNMAQLQGSVSKGAKESKGRGRLMKSSKEGLHASSGSWSWAWALETDERPPPSSIVSRRDTAEARQLARIADQASLEEEGSISGNHLWSTVVDFLTPQDKYPTSTDGNQNDVPTIYKQPTRSLSRFMLERKETVGEEPVEHAFMKP